MLPGVAVAYLLGLPFFIGAFVTGALTSLGIGAIERHTRIKSDAAMGIMFTGAFALGVVLISKIASSTHLMHILFGNVLGVQQSALLLTLAASLVALLMVWLAYRPLMLYAFDPTQAQALGFNTGVIHYGLILLLTLTIVASLETVGIILVVAMLITPGATAHLLTDRFKTMLFISVGIGVGSAVLGLWLSFAFDVASGGTIVLVATGVLLHGAAVFAQARCADAALAASPSGGFLAPASVIDSRCLEASPRFFQQYQCPRRSLTSRFDRRRHRGAARPHPGSGCLQSVGR